MSLCLLDLVPACFALALGPAYSSCLVAVPLCVTVIRLASLGSCWSPRFVRHVRLSFTWFTRRFTSLPSFHWVLYSGREYCSCSGLQISFTFCRTSFLLHSLKNNRSATTMSFASSIRLSLRTMVITQCRALESLPCSRSIEAACCHRAVGRCGAAVVRFVRSIKTLFVRSSCG
jgi:hypothetical protein